MEKVAAAVLSHRLCNYSVQAVSSVVVELQSLSLTSGSTLTSPWAAQRTTISTPGAHIHHSHAARSLPSPPSPTTHCARVDSSTFLRPRRSWFLSAVSGVVDLCGADAPAPGEVAASVPAELALAVETLLLSRCHDKARGHGRPPSLSVCLSLRRPVRTPTTAAVPPPQVLAAVRESCAADEAALERLWAREQAAPLAEFLGAPAQVAPRDFQVACDRLALLHGRPSPLVRAPLLRALIPPLSRQSGLSGSPHAGCLHPLADGHPVASPRQAKLICLRDTLTDLTRSFQRRSGAPQPQQPAASSPSAADQFDDEPSSPAPEAPAAVAAPAPAPVAPPAPAPVAPATSDGRQPATAEVPPQPEQPPQASSSTPCALLPATSSPLAERPTAHGPDSPSEAPLPSPSTSGRGLQQQATTMSADDVLPLVISLVATARVPGLASQLRFIELFFMLHPSPAWPGNADLLKGQLGYVLATFQCAAAHLLFLARPPQPPPLQQPGREGWGRGWGAGGAEAGAVAGAGVGAAQRGQPTARHRRSWSLAFREALGTSPPAGANGAESPLSELPGTGNTPQPDHL